MGDSTGIVTIGNDDATPAVSVAVTDAAGAEQNRDPLSFVINRTANLVGDIVVNLSWTGSAALITDYTLSATGGVLSANGLTLTMSAGSSSATITATPVDDTAVESGENITVSLLTGNGYASTGTTTATGSIADNDSPAVVSLTATDSQGAEQGSDPLAFTIARTANSNSTITINLSWSGNATLGTDYTLSATGGTLSGNGSQLTLAAGVTSATITVTPLNDTLVELNESVALALSAGTGYTLGSPSSQNGTIIDNDLPTLSISSTSVTEGNNGASTVTLTVTLSAAKSTPITVAYTTANGTAVAPSDYQSKSGTLTFAPGVTLQTVSITINGDRTKESNETFQVGLSNPAGATIATGTGTVTILDDEKPLLAAEPVIGSASMEQLTAPQLDAVVAEAAAYWLSVDPHANLEGISFSVAEMDGLILGLTAEREITLDATAAGYGWFIDSTQRGVAPALGTMDLLSVVTHEMGHVLGFDHDDAATFTVMDEDLEAGSRYFVDSAALNPGGVQASRSNGGSEFNFNNWLWDDGRKSGSSMRWNASTGDFDQDGEEWNPYAPIQTSKPRKGMLAKLWRTGLR